MLLIGLRKIKELPFCTARTILPIYLRTMHTKIRFALVMLAFCLIGMNADSSLKARWAVFKERFGKNYSSTTEESFRWANWQKNLREIDGHNELYHSGNSSYYMEENKFTDMSHEEFQRTVLAKRERVKPIGSPVHEPSSNQPLPQWVDWRRRGYVTSVKDQGPCGSCYAFSATGGLEGQFFAVTGNLLDLSESNLVDCTRPWGNIGCHGGLMDNAFEYIIHNGGIDLETSYPYHPVEGRCRFSKQWTGATMWGYRFVPQFSEEALKEAVARIGPIPVAINAASLQHYGGGVFDDPGCDPQLLDHAVLITGYGVVRRNEQEYWMVKNSWGEAWGERGYIKMSRNRNNQCGIASYAVYPIV